MTDEAASGSRGTTSEPADSDEAGGERASGTGVSERLPAPLRLRSAGFGVVVAGLALAGLSVLLPYGVVAGLLVAVAIAGGLVLRGDEVLVQLCLGVGSLGALGLIEGLTAAGLGLGPLELGGLAVAFGLVDILLGTVLARLRSDVV